MVYVCIWISITFKTFIIFAITFFFIFPHIVVFLVEHAIYRKSHVRPFNIIYIFILIIGFIVRSTARVTV